MEKINIKGTIDIDGIESEFTLTNDINDVGWVQWGASQERLGDSMNIVEGLQAFVMNSVGYYSSEEEE